MDFDGFLLSKSTVLVPPPHPHPRGNFLLLTLTLFYVGIPFFSFIVSQQSGADGKPDSLLVFVRAFFLLVGGASEDCRP